MGTCIVRSALRSTSRVIIILKCLEYVRAHRFKYRLHAVRGYGGAKAGSGSRSFGILRNTYVDGTTGVTVQNVDTDVGKSQLANMLARKEPGPGYVHLPCGVNGEDAGGWDIEAVAELTAEYRREQKRLHGDPLVQADGASEPPSGLFSVQPSGVVDLAAKD